MTTFGTVNVGSVEGLKPITVATEKLPFDGPEIVVLKILGGDVHMLPHDAYRLAQLLEMAANEAEK